MSIYSDRLKAELFKQFSHHLLAIISLVVAISALSYNTYRDDLSEVNRNIRHASFELLKELNHLQLLIDYAHYEKNDERGNSIKGWGHVMYIKDMSYLISKSVISGANHLSDTWAGEWSSLKDDLESNQRITVEIARLRKQVRIEVKTLK